MSNNNPFDLDDNAAYESWRAEKLKDYPEKAEELVVEIKDPHKIVAKKPTWLSMLALLVKMQTKAFLLIWQHNLDWKD